jgi:hypothetical protein
MPSGVVPGESRLLAHDKRERTGPEGFDERAAFSGHAARKSVDRAHGTHEYADGEVVSAPLGLAQGAHGLGREGIGGKSVGGLRGEYDELAPLDRGGSRGDPPVTCGTWPVTHLDDEAHA